ncbi:MAG: effector protein ['Conium maculatum' witches'-broom phytoplasma]|nr:effector protein ['Conium maculatum' witches'-broom phytoplasma]
MLNFRKRLKLFNSLIVLLIIINNNYIIASPNENFIGDMRVVDVTISNINILKNHSLFQKYFDYTQEQPCYNADLDQFSIVWKIKDPLPNLLGVFFDNGTRFDEDNKYTLEELKNMGNGAKNMYIFWKYKE